MFTNHWQIDCAFSVIHTVRLKVISALIGNIPKRVKQSRTRYIIKTNGRYNIKYNMDFAELLSIQNFFEIKPTNG